MLLEILKASKDISELKNVRKLKGFHSAYRVRIGSYRVGLVKEENKIILVRVLHRKEV